MTGRIDPLPLPGLEPVMYLDVQVGPPVEAGVTGRGRRRIIPITGGRVDGPMVRGTILPGGADVQVIRPDGVAEIEARYIVATDRGTSVFVENVGLRHAPPEVNARLLAGERVDPELVYFRTGMRVETDDPDLAELERSILLATGARAPDGVRIDVYRLS